MKAIVYDEYGPPDVLRCEDAEKPRPGEDEVLIKVRAAAVNPLDWHFMRGDPYPIRLMAGLRKPKLGLGADVAGQVEAVGRSITRFKPGDEVFGTCRGAFREYVCTAEKALAPKPANLTFEQAAAIPVAGLTALQALRDKGRLQPGQKVLVNGAAGGVGTFAVQIAKAFGAQVIGVCSTRNIELVRSIGADHVIDYTRQDFTETGQQYDVIFDCVATRSVSASRRAMKPRGIYLLVGGPTGGGILSFLPPIHALVISPFTRQKFKLFLARTRTADLLALKELIEADKVTPVIDRRYALPEVPAAIRYLEEGHARGKVVITVA